MANDLFDRGLLSYLLGIDTPERLLRTSERGAIFENMVIMDRVKAASWTSPRQEFFFYRTSAGLEVDLLIKARGELKAFEIKFAKTLNSKMKSALARFQEEHPEAQCSVLSLHEAPFPLSRTIQAHHWRDR